LKEKTEKERAEAIHNPDGTITINTSLHVGRDTRAIIEAIKEGRGVPLPARANVIPFD
jgi:hypothetical protein